MLLVVDSDDLRREWIKRQVGDLIYVIGVKSAYKSIELAVESKPSLVLLREDEPGCIQLYKSCRIQAQLGVLYDDFSLQRSQDLHSFGVNYYLSGSNRRHLRLSVRCAIRCQASASPSPRPRPYRFPHLEFAAAHLKS